MPYAINQMPFDIGATAGVSALADEVHWEGALFEVPDKDYTIGTNPIKARVATDSQNATKIVRCVRNNSGIALLPGRIVRYKAGSEGFRVDGYTCTTAERGAGIVDPFLPAAGVADKDLFYITVNGCDAVLTSLTANEEAVFSAGSVLIALTAATSQATTAGRVTAQDLTGATALLGNQLQNRIGVALSASTTANTNSSKLTRLMFW